MNGEEFRTRKFAVASGHDSSTTLHFVGELNNKEISFFIAFYTKQFPHTGNYRLTRAPIDSTDAKIVLFTGGRNYGTFLVNTHQNSQILASDTNGQGKYVVMPTKLSRQNYDSISGNPYDTNDSIIVQGTFYEPFSKNYR